MEIGLNLKATTRYTDVFWDEVSIEAYQHPYVKIAPSVLLKGQKALVAEQNIVEGEIIFVYTGRVSEIRTRTSIQVDEDSHLEAGDFGSLTNHSCDPNSLLRSKIHLDGMCTAVLIAVKDIMAGSEINFNYATTETELTPALASSKCMCGTKMCAGEVPSFYKLTDAAREELFEKGLLTDYLRAKMINC